MAEQEQVALVPVPGLAVEVVGDEQAARQLGAEYGDDLAPSRETAARLVVRFVDRLRDPDLRDGHKTVGWSARVERPHARELVLTISLRGRPRWFGLSLVQGYLIEPALSLLAPMGGGVLLPAAAIASEGSALLLVGRSGAGKSSLALRAAAAGLPVLGDDQVLVAEDGTCTRFPRRLRLYDDAAHTAPAAIAGLPGRYRRGLALRRLLRIATGGFVAPSLAVPAAALPGHVPAPPAPLGSVVLLQRDAGAAVLATRVVELPEVLDRCAEVLVEQRRRLLGRSPDLALRVDLDGVVARERRILTRALRHVPAVEVTSPGAIGAAAALTAVAREIGLP